MVLLFVDEKTGMNIIGFLGVEYLIHDYILDTLNFI